MSGACGGGHPGVLCGWQDGGVTGGGGLLGGGGGGLETGCEFSTGALQYHNNSKAYIPPERKIPGVGGIAQHQNFALGIPTCWFLKCENLRYPTPNPRRQT